MSDEIQEEDKVYNTKEITSLVISGSNEITNGETISVSASIEPNDTDMPILWSFEPQENLDISEYLRLKNTRGDNIFIECLKAPENDLSVNLVAKIHDKTEKFAITIKPITFEILSKNTIDFNENLIAYIETNIQNTNDITWELTCSPSNIATLLVSKGNQVIISGNNRTKVNGSLTLNATKGSINASKTITILPETESVTQTITEVSILGPSIVYADEPFTLTSSFSPIIPSDIDKIKWSIDGDGCMFEVGTNQSQTASGLTVNCKANNTGNTDITIHVNVLYETKNLRYSKTILIQRTFSEENSISSIKLPEFDNPNGEKTEYALADGYLRGLWKELPKQLADIIYPVGSVIITSNKDFNPMDQFPGTLWAKLSNAFIYASTNDANVTADKVVDSKVLENVLVNTQTSGSENIVITTSNLPEHTHTLVDPGHYHEIVTRGDDFNASGGYKDKATANFASDNGTNVISYNDLNARGVEIKPAKTNIQVVSSGGVAKNSVQPIKILPPYYSKYVWERYR